MNDERQEHERETAGESSPEAEREKSEAPAEEAAGVDVDSEPIEGEVYEEDDPRDTEIGQLRDQLLRSRAEFDNYRKRMSREQERMRAQAAEGIIRDLLPIADNLELALNYKDDQSKGLAEGVEMVQRQFLDVLARNGVKPIEAVGQPFNPEVHEAVAQMPSEEYDAQTVAQEYQKGYMLGDVVLRPSKVVVSTGPADVNAPEQPQEQATDN